jgi:ferrous iron transport protein B
MNRAAIIGSPNSGKSLLFNRLTGLNHKVANFPGITVDVSEGKSTHNSNLLLADYPGVYSLQAISGEEQVAVDAFLKALQQNSLQCVVCVLDVTRMAKGLAFVLQAIDACHQAGKPVIIAANMADTLQRHRLDFDSKGLAQALGVTVISVSGKTKQGIEQLHHAIESAEVPTAPTTSLQTTEQDANLIAKDSTDYGHLAQQLSRQYGPKGDLLINAQNQLDRFFLHSWFGGISFLVIMYLLLQSIFTWAAPLMDGVEMLIGLLADWVLPTLPEGIAYHFVKDALFGGVGAFLVFVPQIFILTLIVGVLEDSGYLSRAAVICHKPLRFFGLTGKSFIPMLSGFACAIPGIYAARTIDSPYKRWLTYMAIPLMPCSARLPVYGLLIAAFIPNDQMLGGLLGWQGLAMFSIYLFGILCALLVTAIVSKTQTKRDDLPFILEMPPYRLPSWRPVLRNAWERAKHFVTKAGPIIFNFSVIIWVLGYFPTQGEDLSQSWLGMLGQTIEPIFAPLGLDWKYGIAILSSFVAREVFVGTLGTLFGVEGAEDDVHSLAEQIQLSGLETGAGIALLVFFAIAMQCISTLAILKKETGGWRLPIQIFVSYALLAYGAAWLAYQIFNIA